MCRTPALTIASLAILLTLAPESAVAGEYSVGNCKADQLNYNARVRRLCPSRNDDPAGVRSPPGQGFGD